MKKQKEITIGLNGIIIPPTTVKKINYAKLHGEYGPACEYVEGCIGSCDWCETRIMKPMKLRK